MASWHRWFSLLVCAAALATIGLQAGQAIAQTLPISSLSDLARERAEEAHDQNVPLNYRERGIARLESGELEGALDDLNQALEDDPADLLARHNRADVYSQMRQWDRALDDAEELLYMHPEDGRSFCRRGAIYSRMGKYEPAIADFTEAIRLNPEYRFSYRERGIARLESGELRGALDDLNQALEDDPADSLARRNRADVYSQMRQWDRALDDAEELLYMQPEDGRNFCRRGAIYRRMEKYEPAIADFTEAIRLNPEYLASYRERGLAYSEQKEFSSAVNDLTHTLESSPDDDTARLSRCCAYSELGDYDAATRDAHYLIERNAENVSAIEMRGYLYQQRGYYKEALADFRQAILIAPDEVYSVRMSGLNLSAQGRLDEAIAALTRAIELVPIDSENYYHRAKVHCAAGNWEPAVADLTEAAGLDPESTTTLIQRAAVHELRGDHELAAKDYATVAALTPSHTLAKWPASFFAPAAEAADNATDVPADGDNVLAEFSVPTNELHLVVPARIGEKTLRLVIDTGAGITALDRTHRDLLGPQRRLASVETADGTVRLPVHGPISVGLATLPDVMTGSSGCWDLAIADAFGESHIDGILGMDVLSQFVVRIDVARHKVSLLRSCGDDPGVAIAFTNEGGLKASGSDGINPYPCPRILLTLPNGESVPFLVDTGMAGKSVAVSPADYDRFVAAGQIVPVRSSVTGSLDSICLTREGVLANTAIGGFEHRNLSVEDCPAGNIIGLACLARFVVTFDFPNRRLFLKPSPWFASSEAEIVLRRGRDWCDHIDTTSPAEVLDTFNEVLAEKPDDPLGYKLRGIFLARQGEMDKAIADYTEAIRLDPADVGSRFRRAGAYRDQGQSDRAIADYSEVIRLDPADSDSFFGRALAYCDKTQFDRAIVDFSSAIRLKPKWAGAFHNRGTAHLAKGAYDRAIADYGEALRLDPKRAGTFHYRAIAWASKRNFKRALGDIDEALRLDPALAEAVEHRTAFLAAQRQSLARGATCGRLFARWQARHCRRQWRRQNIVVATRALTPVARRRGRFRTF